MPQVILIRHAKAVDRMDADDDFDRGLTPRGFADAERAAAALSEAGLTAALALVSPAARTRLTFDRIAAALGAPPAESPMALYHASPDFLRRAIEEALARAPSVVLVGHNPGIGALAHDLAWRAGAAGRMPQGYPTAAVAAFGFEQGEIDRPQLLLAFNPKD
ncbi:MAG: histidine phosphatase family protein [Maricaulaceae bacterium]|nr:histidine phosphatase family protein [Maricaulaceae bacterium]